MYVALRIPVSHGHRPRGQVPFLSLSPSQAVQQMLVTQPRSAWPRRWRKSSQLIAVVDIFQVTVSNETPAALICPGPISLELATSAAGSKRTCLEDITNRVNGTAGLDSHRGAKLKRRLYMSAIGMASPEKGSRLDSGGAVNVPRGQRTAAGLVGRPVQPHASASGRWRFRPRRHLRNLDTRLTGLLQSFLVLDRLSRIVTTGAPKVIDLEKLARLSSESGDGIFF